MKLISRAIRSLIHLYQRATAWRVSPCRFVPSCSVYADEAIEMHGALIGSALAVKRVCSCHPWGRSGYDPVPPPRVQTRKRVA